MKRSKLLLAPFQKRLLYLTTGVLWLSGLAWLYLYEANPLRPLWLKIHGAAAMVFLIVFGTLLVQHVPSGWKQDRQRPSGTLLLAFCGILILTGWGLYYLGGDDARQWTGTIHTFIGLVLPVIIVLHIWLGRRSSAI